MALRLGARGLESDVWLSRDGQVIIDHDGVAGGRLRRSPIRNVDRSDLPDHMPTLSELFEHCGTDFELSLDIKDEAAAAEVVRLSRRADPSLVSRLWLCHPDISVVEGWRKLSDTVKLVDSTRLRKIKEGPEPRAQRLVESGIDAVNMHHSDWSGGLVAMFHRFGRYAFAWDAQHERVIHSLVRMGVDAVYSDHVDRLTAALPHS